MNDIYHYEFMKDNAAWVKQYVISGNQYRFGWHGTIELMIVLDGEVEVFSDGNLHRLETDDILLINSNSGHSIFPLSPTSIILVTELSALCLETFDLNTQQYHIVFASDKKTRYDIQYTHIRYSIAKILRHLQAGEKIDYIAAEALATVLFSDIIKQSELRINDEPGEAIGKKVNEVIKKVTNYIETNYHARPSLSEIADAAGYNKTYLSTLFKKIIGISIYEYMTRVKLRNALTMMESDEGNLLDIALSNGFADGRSFKHCMEKYCGKSPQEYRHLLVNNKQRVGIARYYVRCPNTNVENQIKQYMQSPQGDARVTDSNNYMLKKEITLHCSAILDLIELRSE